MINVNRDVPAPASLEAGKFYRNEDVLDALHTVFKGKCYLTEKVFDSKYEMEIDHFVPQNERPDLVCDWDNLYAIDQKANKKKPKATPSGGYLDPCDTTDDVESDLVYVVEFAGNVLFRPKDATNQKAVNTAKLLEHLHRDLKQAIQNKHHQVVLAVAEWRTAKDERNELQMLEKELLLRKLLSRESQFTMLMRSIRVVQSLPDTFFD